MNVSRLSSAIQDFRYARRKAALQIILARLSGRSPDLLPFEQVKKLLNVSAVEQTNLEDIPLDAIIGSVGRYDDFTRKFLPRSDSDESRWAGVKLAVEDVGLPPIDVYQLGEVYFVIDGNHRVSVARQLHAPTIQAYVTKLGSKIPLSLEDQRDDLIIKTRYAEFLEVTGLEDNFPDLNLLVSAPGQYRKLRDQISGHNYFLSLKQKRDVEFKEAVLDWVKYQYFPVIKAIRQQAILRDFPGRTETDLYIFLMEHRAELTQQLGWEVQAEEVLFDFTERFSPKPKKIIARLFNKLVSAIIPELLETGPAVGQWRKKFASPRREDCLFSSILVPISGSKESWVALEQALVIASKENANIRGLHLVAKRGGIESTLAESVKVEFDRRCGQAGTEAQLIIEVGQPARTISRMARWHDLVVTQLSFPPADKPLARLRSGIRELLQTSPRPVLVVGRASPMQHVLLSYDASPKAEEALYLATYLAVHWGVSMVVLPPSEKSRVSQDLSRRARSYLEARGVEATFVQKQNPAGEALLEVAREYERDLIIMGGYSSGPVLEMAFGSTVDQILREFKLPVLVCR
ncbi:MAG: universal stress protein [Chloroflexi bacterium]|nr:universal stress protein [Chloroflexota bacterium]